MFGRIHPSAWVFALVLPFAGLSCSDKGGSSPDPERGEQSAVPESGEAETSEPAGEERLFFDLLAHPHRAEHWIGDRLAIDFGTAQDNQYTLGGWRTRMAAATPGAEGSIRQIRGPHGRFIVPPLGPGAHQMTLRVASRGARQLTVYLDDQTLRHVELPSGAAFATVTVDIPEGRLVGPEQFAKLRLPSTGSSERALLLDWVTVGPAGEARDETEDMTPFRVAEFGEQEVQLPTNSALSFLTDVGEGIRFRGSVREGTVVLSQGEEELGRFGDGQALDLALAPSDGEVVRIRLSAPDGARLERPRLVTLAPERTRRLSKPENVLVYLIDTLRKDRLTAYNPDTRVRTPGFDRFAQSATLFERGQAQENWTKPSVATLLSGLFPWEHGATEGEAALPASVELLSETLLGQGFHTGAFIANGYVSTPFGFRQGWSSFRNYIKSGRRTQARFVAADVLDWLDERPEDKPFFLYVHTIDPHVPYLPPDSILETYDPDPYHGPINFAADREILEKIKSGSIVPSARDRRRLEALYDGEVTYHDQHFHSIMEGLRRRGLWDNTMIVVTADHGEEFFDHGSVGHGHSVWQELLNVPLAIRVPGQSALRIADPVGLVDVVPTVFELLELPAGDATGTSLVPLLQEQAVNAPTWAVSGFMNGWRTIVSGRYKLIQRTENRVMLFDLVADPGEENDIAQEHPLAVRHLRGLLGLALSGELSPEREEHSAETIEIDDTLRQQLQAIGYVDPETPNQPVMQ